MPIYDYVCSSCGHRMEVMHGVHAHGPSECPACGGQLRKAFAPPAVHFKGTGWAKKERSSKPAAPSKTPGATASESGTPSADASGGGSSPGSTAGTAKPASAPARDAGSGKD